jgi:hypothetical protein
MLRTICRVVSVNLLPSCDRPLASPKAKPMPPNAGDWFVVVQYADYEKAQTVFAKDPECQ